MSAATPRNAADAGAPRGLPGTLGCVKCNHPNPGAAEECERCGARLWVVCHECGAKSRRSEPACPRCNRRLRKAKRARSQGGGLPEGRVWMGVAVIVLLLLALAGLWAVVGRARLPHGSAIRGSEAMA